MNKLIQEFAEKCTVSCIDGRGVELNEIDVEKFAQTIIKECIEQIHGADVGDLKAKSYYLDKVAEHIEKHFGVEESKGWVCPKCSTDRSKAACPKGHTAALTGDCPMVAVAHGVEE